MIYEYECQICKHRTTAVRTIAERNNGPDCCNGKMEKHIFTAPANKIPMWDVDYFCKALGQPITSMRQRKYLMDKGGLVDADEFGKPDFEKMAAKSKAVKEYKQPEVPMELQDAMVREGMADML
jgi:hypothetical protein